MAAGDPEPSCDSCIVEWNNAPWSDGVMSDGGRESHMTRGVWLNLGYVLRTKKNNEKQTFL